MTASSSARLIYLLLTLFAALAVWVVAGCSQAAPTGNPAGIDAILANYPELKGRTAEVVKVTRIIDGDTFVTSLGTVRLIGVNTPEITQGKNEPYGEEARAFVEQSLKGQTVYMFLDVGSTDKYGRLLRYVFVDPEAPMFNETLISEGYANVMSIPPNVAYAESFLHLERAARHNNRGLWKSAKPGDSSGSSTAAIAACEYPQIKGNINSKKEKLYHVPGGRSYDKTVAEEVFCTEEEAVANGYRKTGG